MRLADGEGLTERFDDDTTAKFRTKIQHWLQSEETAADPDLTSQYVMEMANNLKSRAEVKEELGIFLDDKAEIFVLWLWEEFVGHFARSSNDDAIATILGDDDEDSNDPAAAAAASQSTDSRQRSSASVAPGGSRLFGVAVKESRTTSAGKAKEKPGKIRDARELIKSKTIEKKRLKRVLGSSKHLVKKALSGAKTVETKGQARRKASLDESSLDEDINSYFDGESSHGDESADNGQGGIPTSFTFDLSTGKHGGAGKSRLQAKKKQRKAKGENLESAVGGPHKLVIKPKTTGKGKGSGNGKGKWRVGGGRAAAPVSAVPEDRYIPGTFMANKGFKGRGGKGWGRAPAKGKGAYSMRYGGKPVSAVWGRAAYAQMSWVNPAKSAPTPNATSASVGATSGPIDGSDGITAKGGGSIDVGVE